MGVAGCAYQDERDRYSCSTDRQAIDGNCETACQHTLNCCHLTKRNRKPEPEVGLSNALTRVHKQGRQAAKGSRKSAICGQLVWLLLPDAQLYATAHQSSEQDRAREASNSICRLLSRLSQAVDTGARRLFWASGKTESLADC